MESKDTSYEASARIYMREDGRWEQSGDSRGSDMWSDSRYIMEVKLAIFPDEATVRFKRMALKEEEGTLPLDFGWDAKGSGGWRALGELQRFG